MEQLYYGLLTTLEGAWIIAGFVGLWMLRSKGVLKLRIPGPGSWWGSIGWLWYLAFVLVFAAVGGGLLFWWGRSAKDRHCQRCRQVIDPNATVCPHCAREPWSIGLQTRTTG